MLQSNFFFYLVVVVVILIVVGLIVLIHAGLFYKPRVRVVAHPVSPRHVAYVAKTGPYKNVGSAFRKLGSLAPKTTLFGIYYDDTDKVTILRKHLISMLQGARDLSVFTDRYLRKSCGVL